MALSLDQLNELRRRTNYVRSNLSSIDSDCKEMLEIAEKVINEYFILSNEMIQLQNKMKS